MKAVHHRGTPPHQRNSHILLVYATEKARPSWKRNEICNIKKTEQGRRRQTKTAAT